jgi:hypothetical protein
MGMTVMSMTARISTHMYALYDNVLLGDEAWWRLSFRVSLDVWTLEPGMSELFLFFYLSSSNTYLATGVKRYTHIDILRRHAHYFPCIGHDLKHASLLFFDLIPRYSSSSTLLYNVFNVMHLAMYC